ncbi:RNA-binding protein with multiple splicing-like [Zingiber officinale]|uniref:RNA-binding protein with multiple splicing-like n=1 Tax=Zingiber officinale TaxID=94328 RepID=UPI001C4D10AD|nr:RNA-binding protein with multiple splicing-like [Zingiber officinale]
MAGAGMHPYQQQWVPAMVPLIAGEPSVRPAADEVRTIFITGLPGDVKERELHNLLRWLPGFEASQINYKAELPMGFALFSTAQHALAAKDAIQDLVFDSDMDSVLHTEMAKKNLFVKRAVGSESSSLDQSKRLRTAGDYTTHAGYATPPFHPPPPPPPPPPPVWATPSYIASHPPATYDPYGGYPIPQVAMPTPAPMPAPNRYAPVQNTKDNPPCNTLFIGNLGENVNEEEVKALFSVQSGFKQMKILRQERNTVCFIEFEDVVSAKNVHQNLQGALLASSGRGGMRIQFSKNPFGRRKDSANGASAEPN